MTRLEYNKKLVELLSQAVNDNPELRFSQLLFVYNFVQQHPNKEGAWVDDFYVESADLFEKLSKK